MAWIREEVSIDAPPPDVWRAVHEDLVGLSRWAEGLRRAQAVGRATGKGARVRYELELPGGVRTDLVLEYTAWDRPRRAAGRFADGPLNGTWSYTYRAVGGGGTDLLYEMDYEMRGLLRFAGGALRGQYADGIRRGMDRLKQYLED
ncbi:MAG TPA: SRPBCC family protein [Candidatus Dormibacteraeota bacterium]|nr:SRPBCC family protein [Candidatus Dormibacteraeota bacterium]